MSESPVPGMPPRHLCRQHGRKQLRVMSRWHFQQRLERYICGRMSSLPNWYIFGGSCRVSTSSLDHTRVPGMSSRHTFGARGCLDLRVMSAGLLSKFRQKSQHLGTNQLLRSNEIDYRPAAQRFCCFWGRRGSLPTVRWQHILREDQFHDMLKV